MAPEGEHFRCGQRRTPGWRDPKPRDGGPKRGEDRSDIESPRIPSTPLSPRAAGLGQFTIVCFYSLLKALEPPSRERVGQDLRHAVIGGDARLRASTSVVGKEVERLSRRSQRSAVGPPDACLGEPNTAGQLPARWYRRPFGRSRYGAMDEGDLAPSRHCQTSTRDGETMGIERHRRQRCDLLAM